MRIYIITYCLIAFFLNAPNSSFSQDKGDGPSSEFEYETDEVNVRFIGAALFTESDVKTVIQTGKEDFFNPEEFIRDIARIQKFYFDNGFFSAQIDTSTTINEEDKEISVTFRIRQGDSSSVNKVTYYGLDEVNEEAKTLIFNHDPSVKYNRRYVKENVSLEVFRVLNILNNKGYAFAERGDIEIEGIYTTNPDLQNRVNVHLWFKPGDIYTFGTTDIVITTKRYNFTEEDVRKELQYKQGERYDKDKLLRTENRIASLPLVETNKFEIAYLDSTNKVIDYIIKVGLRNKYELTPELLAYEIRNKFYGGTGVTFSDRNFFGGNRTLNLRVRALLHDLRNSRFEGLAQVTQPYLFGNPNISAGDRLGIEYEIDDELSFLEVSNVLSLTYELAPHVYFRRLIFDWELSRGRIETKQNIFLDDGSEVPPFVANVFLSKIGASTVHDDVDNITFPTRGFYQSLGVEESGLLGSAVDDLFDVFTFKYVKVTLLNKFFFNLTKEIISPSVLAKKFLAGYIYEYGDNVLKVGEFDITTFALPYDIKYTAGGSSSNRGWRSRKLGFVPDQEVGGNFLIEGSLEHRLRPFLNSTGLIKDFGFVTFVDYGNVWKNVEDFRLDQIAVSVGGGLRYFTIVGAVRLDIGLKLYDPNPGHVGGAKWLFQEGARFSDKYQFQFGIGNTF